jgi:hypothetical protein
MQLKHTDKPRDGGKEFSLVNHKRLFIFLTFSPKIFQFILANPLFLHVHTDSLRPPLLNALHIIHLFMFLKFIVSQIAKLYTRLFNTSASKATSMVLILFYLIHYIFLKIKFRHTSLISLNICSRCWLSKMHLKMCKTRIFVIKTGRAGNH